MFEKASGSALLLDEYFDSGDARFLGEVLASNASFKLKALAERWYADPRPEMRRALLAYVDDGCDRPHHRPLVKALFKKAEGAADDETMGRFLVAFDRLIRHRLVEKRRYDWRTQVSSVEQVLRDDVTMRVPARCPEKDRSASKPHVSRGVTRFSKRTRRYLARRVFRYFRRLGRRDPARYRKALFEALARYRDEHLERPEQLVDAWSLLHALFRHSPILLRWPEGIRLAPDHTLAELTPAPLYPEAWKGCRDDVLDLVERAASRTVRKTAITLLKRDYGTELRGLPVARLRALLRSPADETQELGAELLAHATDLGTLPVDDWMELLSVKSLTALTLVCDLVKRHVAPERLSLDQAVSLALSSAAPVAELGLSWAKGKPAAAGDDLTALVRLREASIESVRADATAWLVERLRTSPLTSMEHVRDLLDSRHEDVREAALPLLSTGSPWVEDRTLWLALSESPYPDMRAFLVSALDTRAEALDPNRLRAVYASALLAVHQGSRTKRAVLTQIAREVVHEPSRSEELLPLLALLLRSVRPSERKSALAAVTRTAFRDAAFRALLEKRLPGLTFEGFDAA